MLLPAAAIAQDYIGTISGKVIDARTLEALPHVHVLVRELQSTGTSTDTFGVFVLKGLDVGTYSLAVSAVGYLTQVVTNVVTTTGRASPVLIRLREAPIEIEGVTA